MIREQERVYIGKGKKVLDFEPDAANKGEILKGAMGRSGNLRAPALRAGKRMFIGYNEAIYETL